jgi:hypothetical protein
MSDDQLRALKDASRTTHDELALNRAWKALAEELGFVWYSASPVPGKSAHYFTAEKAARAMNEQVIPEGTVWQYDNGAAEREAALQAKVAELTIDAARNAAQAETCVSLIEKLATTIAELRAEIQDDNTAVRTVANECRREDEAAIARLTKALTLARDLIWSAFAHVSHGGPTRKEAEQALAKIDAALGKQVPS